MADLIMTIDDEDQLDVEETEQTAETIKLGGDDSKFTFDAGAFSDSDDDRAQKKGSKGHAWDLSQSLKLSSKTESASALPNSSVYEKIKQRLNEKALNRELAEEGEKKDKSKAKKNTEAENDKDDDEKAEDEENIEMTVNGQQEDDETKGKSIDKAFDRKLITFNDLKLCKPLVKACSELNYDHPTAIQEKLIPAAMEGLDILGNAVTGSGKTAAFFVAGVAQIGSTTYHCPTNSGTYYGTNPRISRSMSIYVDSIKQMVPDQTHYYCWWNVTERSRT